MEVPQLTSALTSPSFQSRMSPTPILTLATPQFENSLLSPSFQLPVSVDLTLATPKKLAAAEQRRIRPARFSCPLCPQRFTTQRNLESTSSFVLEVYTNDILTF